MASKNKTSGADDSIKGFLKDYDLSILDSGKPKSSPIKTLPDLLSLNAKNLEGVIHESLCAHSEYFPIAHATHKENWNRWVINKYSLPNGNITDFAYVLSTSSQSTIVLMEIEEPTKRMWRGSAEKPTRDAAFTAAIEQVNRWRSCLNDPANLTKTISDLSKIFGASPMRMNEFNIKYVLVYGRSNENISDAQKKLFNQTRSDLLAQDIQLYTYDNLVDAAETRKDPRRHNFVKIRATGPVIAFKYQYLNVEPKNEFSYLLPGSLILDADVERLLKSKGFDIDSWKNGKLLSVHRKSPVESLEKSFPELFKKKP